MLSARWQRRRCAPWQPDSRLGSAHNWAQDPDGDLIASQKYIKRRAIIFQSALDRYSIAPEKREPLLDLEPDHGATPSALTTPGTSLTVLDGAVKDLFKCSEAVDDPSSTAEDVVKSLRTVILSLKDACLFDEASSVAHAFVALLRSLNDPASEWTRAWLATALHLLSNQQAALEQWKDASQSIEEAAQLQQALFEQKPKACKAAYARILYCLGIREFCLDHHDKALASAQKAVDLRKDLFERDKAFTAEYARALDSLSNRLYAVGRHREALEAITRAVRHYSDLFNTEGDAYRFDLARSLATMANWQVSLGQNEEGLSSAKTSVLHFRRLYAERPETYAYDLGKSLNFLSIRQAEAAQKQEAFAHIKEAVEVRRYLCEQRPNSLPFKIDYAKSMNNLSLRQKNLGFYSEGLDSNQEAIDIREGLFSSNPDIAPDLGKSYYHHAILHVKLNQYTDGLFYAQEALRVLQPHFAKHEHQDRQYLAKSFKQMAEAHDGLNQPELAEKARERALQEEATNAQFDHDPIPDNPLGVCACSDY
jgi:hypothetical protein